MISQKQEEMVVLFRENIEFKKEVHSKAVLGNGHNVGLQKCTLRSSLFLQEVFWVWPSVGEDGKLDWERRILIVVFAPVTSPTCRWV